MKEKRCEPIVAERRWVMDNLERLLEDLLEYSEKGLTIDEAMANRIKFFLNIEQASLKGDE